MKTEILHVGQKFRNYKQLSLDLEMEVKSSTNSKKAQIKELERYCKLSKIGHSFTVDEVYDEALSKIENRGKKFR